MQRGSPAVDRVEPAYLWVPPHISTAGADAADLAEDAGLILDPEQRLALDVILAELAGGRWAALEAAIIEARQNGKTVVLQVVALAKLFLFDVRLIVWTAHLFSTTQEAFRDLDAIIAGTPDFARRVKRVSRANGEEGFELVDGARLNFRARSKTAGRGLTGDVVILDEAFALSASEMGSLIPTLSARPNPQIVYASSAGLVGSGVLRSVRDRGRKGGDPSLAYIEWCAPAQKCAGERCDHQVGSEGCALDDVELWRKANPALGRRITVGYVEAERRALPPEEFARERLTWWDEPVAGVSGIVDEDWSACADRDAGLEEPVVLSLDVTPGHGHASVVACGGALHVVEHRRGTDWCIPRLVELCGEHDVLALVVDPTSPAAALIPGLEKIGFTIRTGDDPLKVIELGEGVDGDRVVVSGALVLPDGREQTQACESLLAGVVDHSVRHRDQLALNSAVAGAGRRQVGDSWKWSRRDSDVDISPLVAATNARWLWVQHRPVKVQHTPWFVTL